MTVEIQPIRGMNDVLPSQIGAWHRLEECARELLAAYGYEEIRVPVVEHTALFKRAIGEYTDVVEKEMYTFTDLGGESLTLRPEATAGIMRALISNGMLRGQRHKLWCIGPDVPARAAAEGPLPAVLTGRRGGRWLPGSRRRRGADCPHGTPVAPARHRAGTSRDQFPGHAGVAARLPGEAGRLLPRARVRARRRQPAAARGQSAADPRQQESARCSAIIAGAPLLTDHLDPSRASISLRSAPPLEAVGIPYRVNPRLVRGLDYYNRTVFEWITDALGAQDAVCSGGRYDGLIAQLGGEPTPGVGFAMGIERVVELLVQAGAGSARRLLRTSTWW